MKRIPEPEELMDDAAQALAYAEADFSASNELFVELFENLYQESFKEHALDLGCGPADIPIRLARRHPACRIDALDGAQAMLDLAVSAIGQEEQLADRITLQCTFLPALDLARDYYAAVLSNSLLHHLANPMDIWTTVSHCARPGAAVVVMDLLRPESSAEVDALVRTYAADAPEVLRSDFRNSLYAAYTLEEVRQQLNGTGLCGLTVAQVSDRHLAVTGFLPN